MTTRASVLLAAVLLGGSLISMAGTASAQTASYYKLAAMEKNGGLERLARVLHEWVAETAVAKRSTQPTSLAMAQNTAVEPMLPMYVGF